MLENLLIQNNNDSKYVKYEQSKPKIHGHISCYKEPNADMKSHVY